MAKKKTTKSLPKKPPAKKAKSKSVPAKKNIKKQDPNSKTKIIVTKQGLVEVKVKSNPEKKDNRKYIKIGDNESPEKIKEFNERMMRKEIKFAYYASEGNTGFRYYVIL
jgi:hypothetical protein